MKPTYIAIILVVIILAGIVYYIDVPTGKSTLIIAVKDAREETFKATIIGKYYICSFKHEISSSATEFSGKSEGCR